MEYLELSKETLIHELKQVKKELEVEKMNKEVNIPVNSNIFDLIPVSAVMINKDYSIIWANSAVLDSQMNIIGSKCYRSLYGFDDICKDCPKEQVIEDKKSRTIYIETENYGIREVRENSLYYLDDYNDNIILEMHKNADSKSDELQFLREIAEEYKKESLENKEYLSIQREYLEKVSEDISFPLQEIIDTISLFRKEDKSKGMTVKYNSIENLVQESFNTLSKIENFVNLGEDNRRTPLSQFDIYNEIEEIIKVQKFLRKNEFKLNIHKSTSRLVIGDKIQIIRLLKMLVNVICQANEKGKVHIEIYDIDSNESFVDYKIHLYNDSAVKNENIKFLVSEDSLKLDYIENSTHFERYIERQLIDDFLEKLNGEVKIKNTLKNGLQLELSLPLRIDRSQLYTSKVNKVKSKRKTVAILDKNKKVLNSKLYSKYNIVYISSGEELVDYFYKNSVSMVFIDIMCDDLDGFTILDKLKKNDSDDTIFVAVAKPILEKEKDFYLSYGFSEYLRSPYKKEEIENMIEHYGKQ